MMKNETLYSGWFDITHRFPEGYLKRGLLTYDQGREMTAQQRLIKTAGASYTLQIRMIFGGRESREDTSSPLRQHLPKCRDLSGYTPDTFDFGPHHAALLHLAIETPVLSRLNRVAGIQRD